MQALLARNPLKPMDVPNLFVNSEEQDNQHHLKYLFHGNTVLNAWVLLKKYTSEFFHAKVNQNKKGFYYYITNKTVFKKKLRLSLYNRSCIILILNSSIKKTEELTRSLLVGEPVLIILEALVQFSFNYLSKITSKLHCTYWIENHCEEQFPTLNTFV